MSEVSAACACQSSASDVTSAAISGVSSYQLTSPARSSPLARISSTATRSGAAFPTWAFTIRSRVNPLARTQRASSTTTSMRRRGGSEKVPGQAVVCACEEPAQSVGRRGTRVRAEAERQTAVAISESVETGR